MSTPRFVEVDLARLTAMILMAVYHTAFDLHSFYGWNIDLDHPAWKIVQRGTLILFLMVSGISAVLMRQSIRNRSGESGFAVAGTNKRFFKRGLTILFWATLITVATYFLDPQTFIRFGILHLIAVSSFILPFLLPLGIWNALIGIAIFLIGMRFPFPAPFETLDYVPILPWLGIILIGSALGHLLYVRGWRRAGWMIPKWLRTISIPGKYSLAFYLSHQPIILIILLIVLGLPQG